MGRNRPAEAMPFDGMVRRYLIIYIVNLLLLTNECQQRAARFNRLCARCCTQHLTHTRSGKRHVEPTIGWLCVLRFNSEKSVNVAALTLALPMTPFSRLLSHEHYLSHSKTNKKTRKIWPKALPHYVLIFLCRHREMYYYFVHLRSSCYIMPLFLLLISPSALALSVLCS